MRRALDPKVRIMATHGVFDGVRDLQPLGPIEDRGGGVGSALPHEVRLLLV
jgi:hypothetical protein